MFSLLSLLSYLFSLFPLPYLLSLFCFFLSLTLSLLPLFPSRALFCPSFPHPLRVSARHLSHTAAPSRAGCPPSAVICIHWLVCHIPDAPRRCVDRNWRQSGESRPVTRRRRSLARPSPPSRALCPDSRQCRLAAGSMFVATLDAGRRSAFGQADAGTSAVVKRDRRVTVAIGGRLGPRPT